ncbi:soma ferritin-like [Uloborus diversus]|uniref:soma ferritin-like n=1 Tax=Uloborus diversus TaxID=327109 RepID=UPI0024090AA8|nr:soma ferritin-like [Uloborus diversus]
MSVSKVRQNFHEECEAGINKQINMELYASYVYLSMSYYFDRDDVALPGFCKYFKKSSDEEREHAEKFMKYQNMRGGRIVLKPIEKPALEDWMGGLQAMKAALELEKTVNQSLLDLHGLATAHNDAQMCDFLESEFLKEQVESIKELSDYVTNLQRVGTGLGEYMFDKETLHGEE